MKKIRCLKVFAHLLFMAISMISYSQSTIKGKVIDGFGSPIIGANIVLEGLAKGAITNFDGEYEISQIENGTYVLQASFIGYTKESREITLEQQEVVIDFVLVEDAESLDQVIVTGVVNPKSKLESSVSVTTVGFKKIAQSVPRSAAEIFRTIPGIRSESSGGEGNSQIAARGVPVSAGGAKYLQLQEDGLPILLFGDIAFATADIFTRFDSNIQRIEAIRGGSASTLSSNSPGGIINFISKTGSVEGGSFATTFGLDYSSFRTDFEYGAPISDDLFFHLGGFYRVGEGVRDADFTANNGGQLKFNITKQFDKGYVRLYAKYLNDRAIGYLPMPVAVSGTNSNPDWGNAPNYDATQNTLQTTFLPINLGLGANGELRRSKVADGMRPLSTSVGAVISFDLPSGWKLQNNGRFSFNRGRFVSPFPAQVAAASDIASSFGDGASLSFATDGSQVGAGTLVTRIHMFDTELNNLNNFMNDFKLSKSFENFGLTFGFFKSIQNISMSWLWNSYLQEVAPTNARLINVSDASNNLLSENGLYAYGVPFWGNCCTRNYDVQYNTSAPFFNLSIDASEKFSVDASLRYDMGNVDGSFASANQLAFDVNNDGTLSAPEQSVSAIDNANPTIVNYEYDFVSYSLGANYKFKDRQALFARYSRGGAAKADRILFDTDIDYLDSDRINALDFLNQAEIGYKRGFKNGALYVTGFYAETVEEGGFEASTNSIIENDYESMGVELEGAFTFNNFDLRGAITWTDAKVKSGDNDGNVPRRQPDFIYNIIPSYNFGSKAKHSLGLSLIGQSDAYAQDNNDLVMPGFAIVNGFVTLAITDNIKINVAGNNIFDTLGITETEEGSITEGIQNIVRARSVSGRSLSLSVFYNF